MEDRQIVIRDRQNAFLTRKYLKLRQGFVSLSYYPMIRSSLLLFSIFLATSCTHRSTLVPPPSGWKSPALSAPHQHGKSVNLSQATATKWAVVFFYPEADTPG